MAEMRVVVTKDTDFYYSHLLHGRPWKLVLVCIGNLGLHREKQPAVRAPQRARPGVVTGL